MIGVSLSKKCKKKCIDNLSPYKGVWGSGRSPRFLLQKCKKKCIDNLSPYKGGWGCEYWKKI